MHSDCRGHQFKNPGVHVQMPSTVSTLANYAGNVVMGVGYLQSYLHMGMFKIECVNVCKCEGVPGRSANWGLTYQSTRQPTLVSLRVQSAR